MSVRIFFACCIISIATLTSCSDDSCEVTAYEDPVKYLSITGRVVNAYDNTGVEGVRLSMLDQIGGSYIIRWDTMSVSGSAGCFKYEEERDLDFLIDLVNMQPSLDLALVNQSLRPFDDRYYFLKSLQGEDEIQSFTRWRYDSGTPVQMFVVPAATIRFRTNRSRDNDSFRWTFIDRELSSFTPFGTFSIDEDFPWQIPADREIMIEVLDANRSVIYSTELTPNPGQEVILEY